jgi:hypothetical protein
MIAGEQRQCEAAERQRDDEVLQDVRTDHLFHFRVS